MENNDNEENTNDLLVELVNQRNRFEELLYDFLIPFDSGSITISNLNNHLNSENENENRFNRIVFRYTQSNGIELNENDSFWDPVVVNLSIQEIENLKEIHECNKECIICNDLKNTFKIVNCCNNKICNECTNNWFNRSVYCPFCKSDQRNTV
jgi:hypothetical protein